MPTGYTYGIRDGISFEIFVMYCARAMGALSLMRDEPLDAPVPEFEPDDFHFVELKKAKEQLYDLERITVGEAAMRAAAEYTNAMKRWRESKCEDNDLRAKYEAMLSQVDAWVPPTKDHEELKEFMRDQIQESIRFDCGHGAPPEPRPKTGQEWLAAQIREARDSVEYHARKYADEVKSCQDRNEWVAALCASLQKK